MPKDTSDDAAGTGWSLWARKLSIVSGGSSGEQTSNKAVVAQSRTTTTVLPDSDNKAVQETTKAKVVGDPPDAGGGTSSGGPEETGAVNGGNKTWSFWSNKSSLSMGDAVETVTETIQSNTMYTEELNLWDNSVDPDLLRSTSVTDTSNIVIPSFNESLPKNSCINYLLSWLTKASAQIGYSSESMEKSHLLRNDYPETNFKNVLIIGVHGFFPMKYIRPLIGEPTGTSIKFMSEAENTFKIWLKKNKHYFGKNASIKLSKIALEKEGRIFDRVSFFYDILAKHDLNQYDFIYVAAHSQGTPVSIILMAKLIESGLIKDAHKKKLGILAMAGVSNGPFYGVNKKIFVRAYSTIESDSMLELFEFQNFNSVQSLKYLESLKILLNNNAKVVYIGSINDQLVPLYSSTCLHVEHPNIFRSIYIDKDSDTPNFLVKILNCSLLLKNMGLNDHGMIKEISNALAGPLTGGGHSKIYNEYKVYELGLKFFLYSTNSKNFDKTPIIHKSFQVETLGTNPFFLPWCLRGLMYESICNIKDGERYISLMFQEFDEWNPDTKVLKDIKYRLNAMKAKL